jgi:predicted RNase H-like HicB family nuclease
VPPEPLTDYLHKRSLPDEETVVPAKRKSRVHSYTVLFEPVAEGGYNVVVPAIPEICTFGRTLAESKRMAADAIRCCLVGLEKEHGRFPREVRRAPRVERIEVELEPA